MINKTNGQLTLGKNHKINSKMTLKEFSELNLIEKPIQNSNKTISLTLKNKEIDKRFFNFHFYFTDDILTQFTFVFQNTPFQSNLGWDSWSRENEEDKLELFKNWITKQFGDTTTFNWGEIKAYYNSKSGNSLIEVNYY